jgi:hypothetical protein
MKTLTCLILCFAPIALALAEDFKTINGKEYKNATISRVEPDGIVLKTKSGITKVYFVELPKEVQERFHYDPQKARDYSVEQARGEEQGQAKGSKAKGSKESQTEGGQVTQGEEHLAVEVVQVLPDGILAYGSVCAWANNYNGGEYYESTLAGHRMIFLQGFTGVAEGEEFQVQAHAAGTYTYQDANGASRTLEKWVFTKLIKRLK